MINYDGWRLIVMSDRLHWRYMVADYDNTHDHTHRVTIERTSLSKETYIVKHPQKIIPSGDIFRGVDACVGLLG